jgi:hypothetical protein
MTLWTGDQPVAWPLPTQDNTNADIHGTSEGYERPSYKHARNYEYIYQNIS